MKYLLLLALLASCASTTTTPTSPTTTVEPTVIAGDIKTPTCTCPPVVVTPPVVVVPPVNQEPRLLALDEFSNPQLDSVNWKSSVTRTVFKNQVTGFAIKPATAGNLCLLANKAGALKLLPIQIKNPSAKEYAKGEYYDAMEALTDKNCADAKYAWLDLAETTTIGGMTINIKKLATESLKPQIPLLIQLSSYAYQMGMDKGVYVNGHESLVKDGMQMLVDHRIQPMKSWVTPYSIYSAQYGLKEYVVDYSLGGPTSVPQDGNLSLLNTDVIKYNVYKPWMYVIDEPSGASVMSKLKADLANFKSKYPNLATMVTTTYQKDFAVDIYVPVAEHMDMYPRSTYGRLWMYVSCMSNGCGENRDWLSNVNGYKHIDYNRTGAPDAPKRDAFGFFQIAIKYNLEALLYYNSIEQWALAKKGVDNFVDQYNFGANGDGTLLYPDYANKKPLASLRLKMLREASFFADAVILGGSQEVIKGYVSNATSWNFNYLEREKAYSKLK